MREQARARAGTRESTHAQENARTRIDAREKADLTAMATNRFCMRLTQDLVFIGFSRTRSSVCQNIPAGFSIRGGHRPLSRMSKAQGWGGEHLKLSCFLFPCRHVLANPVRLYLIVLFFLLNRWPEVVGHKDDIGNAPMKLLIEQFPESAELLMDYCVKRSEKKGSYDPNFPITCDFSFLDPGPDDTTSLNGHRFYGPISMVEHERRSLLFHPLTKVWLKKKWSAFGRFVYYFDFLSYLAFVGMYTDLIIKERNYFDPDEQTDEGKTFSYAVFSFTVIQLIKEIVQIFIQRLRYFTVLNNLMEWFLYGTAFVFMIPFITPTKDDERWMVGVTSIFLCYANLVLFLRRSSLFGIYVSMFIEVTKTVLKVLLVFFVFVFGFSMVFFVLFKEQVKPELICE